jgi:hypothetical protein
MKNRELPLETELIIRDSIYEINLIVKRKCSPATSFQSVCLLRITLYDLRHMVNRG